MKILFITDNFPPEINAPATRTFDHCREWIKHGAEITVITCAPNYPQGKVYPGYKNKFYQTEMVDGIKVIRVWSYITRNEGFLKRIIDYISFAIMSFFAGLFIKTDIIIATSPQFFTTISGWLLSFFKRRPWVFELRDLWPESIFAVKAINGKKIIAWLTKLEMFLYRQADLIIPVTDAFEANLVRRGIDPQKIAVVTNGSNLELFRAAPKDAELLKRLNLQSKIVIGYIGTHGLAHDLQFIVTSISRCLDEKIHFLFIGDGADKKNIVRLAEELRLKNCTFLSPVVKEEVPRYLSVLDIFLVPLAKSDTFKTVIPSKIFESACMLKPILLGVEGQAKQIIDQYHAGICFEPGNESDFLTKLDTLASDKELYDVCKSGCEMLSRSYDRKVLALKMLNLLQKQVGLSKGQ